MEKAKDSIKDATSYASKIQNGVTSNFEEKKLLNGLVDYLESASKKIEKTIKSLNDKIENINSLELNYGYSSRDIIALGMGPIRTDKDRAIENVLKGDIDLDEISKDEAFDLIMSDAGFINSLVSGSNQIDKNNQENQYNFKSLKQFNKEEANLQSELIDLYQKWKDGEASEQEFVVASKKYNDFCLAATAFASSSEYKQESYQKTIDDLKKENIKYEKELETLQNQITKLGLGPGTAERKAEYQQQINDIKSKITANNDEIAFC